MTDNFPPDIFYGSRGPHDADIMIIGESWGTTENAKKLCFVGLSGHELTDRLLPECDIDFEQCYMTNVIPVHPGGNDMSQFFIRTVEANKTHHPRYKGLFPKPIMMEAVERLRQQILAVKPKVIIGFGNYVLWAITDDCFSIGDEEGYKVPTGIISWRGSQLYTSKDFGEFPYLPTIHPAAYIRNWPWRYHVKHDLKQRLPKVWKDEWAGPNYNFLIRPNFKDAVRTLEGLIESLDDGSLRKIAPDIETRREHIACIGLAWSRLDAICIPFMTTDEPYHYWSEEEEIIIILLMRLILNHPNVELVGQNFLYDDQYIGLYWCTPCRVKNDTMIKHHTAWPGTPRGLHYLSSMYCEYHRYWKDESKNWDPKMGEEQLWVYNCKDSVTTYEVDDELDTVIDQLNLREQYEFQMRQWYMIRDMMVRGVLIDKQRRVDAAFELNIEINAHEEYLEKLIPPDVWPRDLKKASWPRSSAQQREIFYDVLGMKEIKLKGKRTANDMALELIGNREPLLEPITTAIREIRSLGVFFSTFTKAKLDPDGKMRSSYDPSGTETYRWSSKKNAFDRGANLQNIPEGVDLDE